MKVYTKLVRNKIPSIIKNTDKECEIRILTCQVKDGLIYCNPSKNY